jgi:hypothetical protein
MPTANSRKISNWLDADTLDGTELVPLVQDGKNRKIQAQQLADLVENVGSIAAYIHNQASASFTWTINHNLGYRPAVTVFNSGSQEIDAAVSHPTVNQAVVSLTVSTSGFARLL